MSDKPKFDPSIPFTVVSESKPKFDPSIPFEEVQSTPSHTEPSHNWLDKLQALPQGISDAASGAYDYAKKSVTGEIGLDEQGRRLGTAARGAIDMIEAPGELFTKGIANLMGIGYKGLGAKGTAETLSNLGLADKAKLEQDDKNFPGARAVGQMLPQLALGGSSILGQAGAGALGSVAAQQADKGQVNAGDVAFDTLLAGGGASALKAAGVAAKAAVPLVKKGAVAGASVATQLPGEMIEHYVNRNAAVRAARPLEDVARETTAKVGELGDEVGRLSGESFGILAADKAAIPKSDVVSILQNKIDELKSRGVFGPEMEREIAGIQGFVDNVNKGPDVLLQGPQAKSLIQQIDENLGVLKKKAADKSTAGQRALEQGRSEIDSMLKGESPAYAEKMREVAEKTRLTQKLNQKFGTEESAYNNLKGIARDKSPFKKELLQDLDSTMGSKLAQEARDSMVADAFTGKTTNGSRNVNAAGAIGGPIGAIIGYAMDSLTRPAIAKSIDLGLALQPHLSTLGKYAQPLMDAAKKGPSALVLTHRLLQQSQPEYAEMTGNK